MGLGRTLIFIGAALIVAGVLVMLGERMSFRFGRLPGDVVVRGKHSVFYFPWVTSLLLSAVLTLIFWLFGRR